MRWKTPPEGWKVKWLLLCLLLLWPGHARAEDWEVVRALPGSGARWAATVTNREGHRLYVWSLTEPGFNEAYIGLHLGGNQRFADIMPTYQIDTGEVVDTGTIRKLGKKYHKRWTFLEDNRCRWRIWVAPDNLVREKHVFRAWLNGRAVRFRYKDSSGTERTTVFSLKNSADAIFRATRVRLE